MVSGKMPVEVIIPAYNEQDSIGEVVAGVKEVLGEGARIIVIDDASTDETAKCARERGAEVIRHPYRIGNGACVKTGIRCARAEVIVLMDADGQHRPQDIPCLLEHIEKFDMVVGKRTFSRICLRNFANRVYNAFARYVTQFRVEDLTCGFRAVKRASAARFLYLLPNGFSYPTTITLALLKTGRTVCYVPIQAPLRRHGKSKIHLVEDGTKFFLIIVRIATYFSPLRVFLPVSSVFFTAGVLYYLHTFITAHRFTNMSALLFTAALIIFMLGLISEQISQLRMDRTED